MDISFLYNLADKETIKKVEKKVEFKDRVRTIISEILTKMLIAKMLGKSFYEVRLKKGLYGKPFLEDCFLSFNVSHSGQWVIIALSNEFEIGIDIEQVNKKHFDKDLFQYFSEQEYQYLNRLKGEKQFHSFFEVWTAKESFVKCLGIGLNKGLDYFTVPLNKKQKYVHFPLGTRGRFRIYYILKDWCYPISLCVRIPLNTSAKPEMEIIEIREISANSDLFHVDMK